MKFEKTMGRGKEGKLKWKDAALFEVAAYAHAYPEYCGSKNGSTASKSPDPVYDEAMQFASSLTAVVGREMSPRMPDDALCSRVEQYRRLHEQDIAAALEEIEFGLVQAFARGDAPNWRNGPLALDSFALTVAVKTMAKIEHVTMIGALVTLVRNLHTHTEELLSECP